MHFLEEYACFGGWECGKKNACQTFGTDFGVWGSIQKTCIFSRKMHVLEVAKSLGKMHAENACFLKVLKPPPKMNARQGSSKPLKPIGPRASTSHNPTPQL